MKKKVTLPIGCKIIFLRLAEIAWANEKNKKNKNKDEYIEKIVQELGTDAFIHSFTPGGEIGDGHNTLANPRERGIENFYKKNLGSLFGRNGSISSMLIETSKNNKVYKNKELRFKEAVISLAKLYVEAYQIDDPESKILVTMNLFKEIEDIFLSDLES
jgi:hypothetical protein